MKLFDRKSVASGSSWWLGLKLYLHAQSAASQYNNTGLGVQEQIQEPGGSKQWVETQRSKSSGNKGEGTTEGEADARTRAVVRKANGRRRRTGEQAGLRSADRQAGGPLFSM